MEVMIKLIQMNKPKNNSIYIYIYISIYQIISQTKIKKHIYTILIMVNLCWSTKKKKKTQSFAGYGHVP